MVNLKQMLLNVQLHIACSIKEIVKEIIGNDVKRRTE